MAKFTAKFRDKEGKREPWTETYEFDDIKTKEEAEKWCIETIQWFNDTIGKDGYPVEPEREFMKIVSISGETFKEHVWHKDCLHTLKDQHGRLYDRQKCRRCGITGKRYGLRGFVNRDYKYRHKDFDRCDTSMERLRKKGEIV